MWSCMYSSFRGRYQIVHSKEEEDAEDVSSRPLLPSFSPRRYTFAVIVLSSLTCIASLVAAIVVFHNLYRLESINPLTHSARPTDSQLCVQPPVRREWRSLSRDDKQEYLRAVQCLRTKPSALGRNQSLYDDFPWLHFRARASAHHAASFVPWHRYFLHEYEQKLQKQCGFKGQLTYWDWSLDWQDITTAPIWDTETGFGGNGDPRLEGIRNGFCVNDGPFAGMKLLYLNGESHPHCLSRGFVDSSDLYIHGFKIRPEAIETILNAPDYEAFNLGLEDGPHDSIPRSVRGDFAVLTAPSDPVFFLHHTQLDRLWWMWQRRHPSMMSQYIGAAHYQSKANASLTDVLQLTGFAPEVTVEEIIDTESGDPLCYRY